VTVFRDISQIGYIVTDIGVPSKGFYCNKHIRFLHVANQEYQE